MPKYQVNSGDLDMVLTTANPRMAAVEAIGDALFRDTILGQMISITQINSKNKTFYMLTIPLVHEFGCSVREIKKKE